VPLNTAAPTLSPAPAAVDDAELSAVLVLDVSGRVVAANHSARQLWGATEKSLIGRPFAKLLVLDGGSDDSASFEAQWKAFLAVALDRSTHHLVQPLQGTPREVFVRIERATGGAGSFIASLRLRAA